MSGEYGVHQNGYRGHLTPRGDRTHYRYGYQVGDAEPRYLGIVDANAEKKAAHSAKAAASEVAEQLAKLGAPVDVSWWTQKVTATTTVECDEPNVEVLT